MFIMLQLSICPSIVTIFTFIPRSQIRFIARSISMPVPVLFLLIYVKNHVYFLQCVRGLQIHHYIMI